MLPTLGAVCAIIGLVISVLNLRLAKHKANLDEVDDLREQVGECLDDKKILKEEQTELKLENLQLSRRVLELTDQVAALKERIELMVKLR